MISEIFHQYRLIEGLKILENECSFELDMGNNRHHLWVLQHLGYLDLAQHEIDYQINRGFRQRKQTIYPVRRMRKHFKNTFGMNSMMNNPPRSSTWKITGHFAAQHQSISSLILIFLFNKTIK
jgi:cytolysin (calcineurin-like family phosphatase)